MFIRNRAATAQQIMRTQLKTWMGLTLTVIIGWTLPTFAQEAPSPTPTPHASGATGTLLQTVPPWVKRAAKVGPADDNERVMITAYLGWQNQPQLNQLLQDVTTPSSAHYGQFLTPAQFHSKFSPRAKDVGLVQDTLRTLGFSVNSTPDSGLFVRASGTIAQIKQAFQISQSLYMYRGKTLRSHAEEPTLPAALNGIVTYIAGLDDSRVLMRPLRVTANQRPARVNVDSVQPPEGSPIALSPCSHYWGDKHATLEGSFPYGQDLPWRPCGYTPQQVREAYGANHAHQTGRGVRIAITDLYASPTIVSDVNTYSANHGLPPLTPANFHQLLAAGVNSIPTGDPCESTGWFGEETLDVTAIHSIAPDADILYVGGACNVVDETDEGVAIDPIYDVIDHRLADIVSNSWLYYGEVDVTAGEFQSDNAEFVQAALQGMSVLFASGDNGDQATEGPNPVASGSWPSTSPYVTSMGGTSLLLKHPSGEKEEFGWGSYETVFTNANVNSSGTRVTQQGYIAPFFWIFGSGGGPSLVMPQPFYQMNVVPETLATETVSATGEVIPLGFPARVTPDMAMLADPFEGLLVGETYAISSPPVDPDCTQLSSTLEYCELGVGGTSLATPLFAAVLALVNEARFTDKRGPVGFVNPALYSLRVGREPYEDAPILDLNAPSKPTGALIGILPINDAAAFFTIDSNLDANGRVVENTDTSLRSAPGYDDVTGLGAPDVPALIRALRRPRWGVDRE